MLPHTCENNDFLVGDFKNNLRIVTVPMGYIS